MEGKYSLGITRRFSKELSDAGILSDTVDTTVDSPLLRQSAIFERILGVVPSIPENHVVKYKRAQGVEPALDLIHIMWMNGHPPYAVLCSMKCAELYWFRSCGLSVSSNLAEPDIGYQDYWVSEGLGGQRLYICSSQMWTAPFCLFVPQNVLCLSDEPSEATSGVLTHIQHKSSKHFYLLRED